MAQSETQMLGAQITRLDYKDVETLKKFLNPHGKILARRRTGFRSATLEKLASMAQREMRRAIQSAFGTAKLAGRNDVQPDDVQVARGARRQKIGF